MLYLLNKYLYAVCERGELLNNPIPLRENALWEKIARHDSDEEEKKRSGNNTK